LLFAEFGRPLRRPAACTSSFFPLSVTPGLSFFFITVFFVSTAVLVYGSKVFLRCGLRPGLAQDESFLRRLRRLPGYGTDFS